jgi:hypothetical protein
MWPFSDDDSESDSKQAEFACDGQERHEYETLEEMETLHQNKYYDAQEEAEVVIVMKIPKVAECQVCGDRIENSMYEWHERGSFSTFDDYDIEFTKVIVNDCSDAERIDANDEFY